MQRHRNAQKQRGQVRVQVGRGHGHEVPLLPIANSKFSSRAGLQWTQEKLMMRGKSVVVAEMSRDIPDPDL